MIIVHRHLYLDFRTEKSFRIRPHGDFQYGNEDVDEKLVRYTLEETANDPFCVSIGVGDLIDTDRPSTRAKRTAAYAGREAELTQDDMKRMHWLDNKFLPMLIPASKSVNQNRGFGLIGEMDGHHHEVYRNGMTSTQYIISKIREKANPESRYLGEMMAYIVLHVHDTSPKSKQQFNIIIHAQHGAGGSSFISSDMAALERKVTPYFDADIYLRGHSTKKYAAMRPILCVGGSEKNSTLHERTLVMVNTGGYLRGYGAGEKATYVEAQCLPPATLGHVVIHVRIRSGGTNGPNYHPEYSVEF